MVTFLRRARFLPSTLANIKVGSCSISMQQAPQKQHRTCGRELTCAQANEYYRVYYYYRLRTTMSQLNFIDFGLESK